MGFSLIAGIGRVRFTQLENYFTSLENAWKANSADADGQQYFGDDGA